MTVLCIDIGGSGLKGALVNQQREMISDRLRVPTPRPAKPSAVINALTGLVQPLNGQYERVAVGFPGIVTNGTIGSAVNLHPEWVGFNISEALASKLSVPVRTANDADIQGYGVINGEGVELVLTLGTGFGSALFINGHLVPNLEMGHHPFRKRDTYEQQLGNAARKKVGNKAWNRRLVKALNSLQKLFNCTTIYIGGGNSKKVTLDLPPYIQLASNQAGIYGGVALWESEATVH